METIPDLAEGPEVYETSDVDSIDFGPRADPIDHGDVQTDEINASQAREVFESDDVADIVGHVDFLGSTAHASLAQTGFDVRRRNESTKEKLLRIAAELRGIEAEDAEEKQQLAALQSQIDAQLVSKGKNSFVSEKLEASLAQLSSLVQPAAQEPILRSLQLGGLDIERRVAAVEVALGSQTTKYPKNLRNHIDDLERKVNALLDPQHELGELRAHMESLNKELETLMTNRRMAQLALDVPVPKSQTAFEGKVEKLYARLDDIDRALPVLPWTIERLRGLNHAHTNLAGAVETVGEIGTTLDSLERDMRQWNSDLDTVNHAVDQHAKNFEANLEALIARLGQLEARVGALGD